MEINDIIKKVKQIELKSLRKTNSLFLGEYHSSFKGRGMIFSEVRPYQYGDDVRKIDWNKTARFQEPFVKVFEEERELTLMLMVDVSASMNFGTKLQTKRETIAEICATLGFSALKNNDKVGLVLFSDQVELFLPPKKGRGHILRMIREIINFEPKPSETNCNVAIDFFLQTIKRRSIVFMLSDFNTKNYERSLQIISKKHDFTGIRMYDDKETHLPNIGFVKMRDLETGQTKYVNTFSKKVRKKYHQYYQDLQKTIQENFKKAQAGLIELQPQQEYALELIHYFRKR